MKKITRHRTLSVLLICIVLAFLLSGYTVMADVRVFSDNRLQSGGDIFWTEGVEDFDIFENLRPPFGGDAIIKPGSEGTYSFIVENRGDSSMTTYFRLFDENAYEIPMAYRLKTEDQYLLGDETTWEDSADLEQYVVKDKLPEHTRREYQLDWCWFNGRGAEADEHDAWIGNQAAAGKDVTYTLQMSLKAETDIEEPEQPIEPEEPIEPVEPQEPGESEGQEELDKPNGEPEEDLQQVVVANTKTGDNARPWIYMAAGLASICVFILILFKKRDKEEEL